MRADRRTQEFIENHRAEEVVKKILSESTEPFLEWFASGDCPPYLTGHIIKIIRMLSVSGMTQHGFTRNYDFWTKSRDINNCLIMQTFDDEATAMEESKHGHTAYPLYSEWRVKIFRGGEAISLCGGGSVICGEFAAENDDEHLENCYSCYQDNWGCYRKAA